DRVLAHRAMGVPVAREKEVALACQRPERPQHRDALAGQRHQVIAVGFFLAIEIALHPDSGDAPQGPAAVEIFEFSPAGAAQLAWPDRGKGKEAQGKARYRPRIVLFRIL